VRSGFGEREGAGSNQTDAKWIVFMGSLLGHSTGGHHPVCLSAGVGCPKGVFCVLVTIY
jgi:hypothetical protein